MENLKDKDYQYILEELSKEDKTVELSGFNVAVDLYSSKYYGKTVSSGETGGAAEIHLTDLVVYIDYFAKLERTVDRYMDSYSEPIQEEIVTLDILDITVFDGLDQEYVLTYSQRKILKPIIKDLFEVSS